MTDQEILESLGWTARKQSLYDEEGVEGWCWESPDGGREICEIADWSDPPPIPEELQQLVELHKVNGTPASATDESETTPDPGGPTMLPATITTDTIRQTSDRLDAEDRQTQRHLDAVNEVMTSYVDAVVEELAAQHNLTDEQVEELSERIAWRLELLPARGGE